jgi:hypothetical protein
VADNDKTIVSRIQHRRGLKQDLPQPLRPGELGLATDSRQLYIGGDPNNPTAADYHSISYYEDTASAKEHVRSIANNNVMAFSVPTFKVVESQFNGTTNQVYWHPTDARSIINPIISQSKTISSKYPVFSPVVTQSVSSALAVQKQAGALTMVVSSVGGQDPLGNIRINDEVIISGFDARPKVTSVVLNTNQVDYDVTIDRALTTIASATAITFIPKNIKNMFTGETFKSSEVTVYKSGVQINPETDSSRTTPSAMSDYAIDASNASSLGSHVLNFRNAPTEKDDATLTYYSNANVISAISGVEAGTMKGNVSAFVEYPSFYQNDALWPSTNGVLPSYKRFRPENIRLSRGTGFGFVGMDLIHISATADGANVSTTNVGGTLGNLFIARDDERQSTSSITSTGNPGDPAESYTISMTSSNDIDRYVTKLTAGDYKYDHVLLVGTSASYEDDYLHRSLFPVTGVGGSQLTISMPVLPFTVGRTATVDLRPGVQGNKFQNNNPTVTDLRISNTSITSDQVKAGDWIRITDNSSGTDANAVAMHDRIFKVKASGNGFFDIRVGDVSTDYLLTGNANVTALNGAISNGNVKFINHGANSTDINTTLQLFSEDHGIKPGGTSEVNINTGVVFLAGTDYEINTGTNFITDNTFFVINRPGSMQAGSVLNTEGAAGGLLAEGDSGIAPISQAVYNPGAFEVVPVLNINLSDADTFDDVIGMVNRNLVEINGTSVKEQIFPQLNWVPHDNGVKNALYLAQRPAYSSVGVGGLEFTLYEDKTTPTLSKLGLKADFYDRPNNTVKAKFEQWINGLVNSRDVNLITDVFPTATTQEVVLGVTNIIPTYYANITTVSTQFSDVYSLTIDNTFNEIAFGSREEAGIFNTVVNNVYGNSLYDKSLDKESGSRGLVNLKNNIEISTRELDAFGNKETTYVTMDEFVITPSDTNSRVLAEFDVQGQFNVFRIKYSLQHTNASGNKYLRTGTWSIAGSLDFVDPANRVLFSDNYTSVFEISSHTDPVVEPKFDAVINPNGVAEIRLVDDQLISSSGTTSYATHNIGTSLRFKYVTERWSSKP